LRAGTAAPTTVPMPDTVAAVRAALATVIDPDLHRDLVSLNMVRNIVVAEGVAAFDLVLTTNACPVKQQLEDQCRAAAISVAGVTRAVITVSAEVPVHAGRAALPGIRHLVGIGSGKGGVGKSTVTANLACALAAAGARVGILDADIYGPSMPTMLGVHRQPEIVDKKMVPVRAHGIQVMSMGFIVERSQAVVWRGPMVVGAIKQFLTDVAWGELDYLLIDLPPGTGDIQITLAQSAPLTGAVVVSTPQAVALDDARRAVAMFAKVSVPMLGIVENMSDFICPSCGRHEAIFGHGGAEREAADLGVPFLGRLPLEPAVRICGDGGTPVVALHPGSASAVAFRGLAERVAARISTVALTAPATGPAVATA
jgi:ATP-binding protein involved in chromosome partitioning